MSEKQKQKRRTFTAEFKLDAVNLIVNQGDSFHATSKSMGIDATTRP